MKKRNLLILVLIALVSTVNAQRQIFTVGKKNSYELFFISVDPEMQDNWRREQPIKFLDYLDSAASFSVTDQDAILELSLKWKADTTNKFYFCWYDYFIYVYKDNQLYDEIRVNEGCKQAVSKYGLYLFDNSPLTIIRQRNELVVFRFSTNNQYKELVQKLKKELKDSRTLEIEEAKCIVTTNRTKTLKRMRKYVRQHEL